MAAAALGIAVGSVLVAVVAMIAAIRSARAAEATEQRARTPVLAILLDHPEPAPNDRVIYRIRNDGPQDLDSVVLHRPRPTDQIVYQLAVTGRAGFADDEIDL